MATAVAKVRPGYHDGVRRGDRSRGPHTFRPDCKEARGSVANSQPLSANLVSTASFRFLDLATELRLAIYDELLERKDPNSPKRLFPQILATSKEICGEARPVLYTKTNLRLTIVATALKSRDYITDTTLHIGRCQTPILASSSTDAVTPAWGLYNSLPPVLSKISNATLQIVLRANRDKGLLKMQLMAEQFNQVHQILAALSALWQVSGAFRTLNVEFLDDTGSIQAPPSPSLHTTFLAAKEMDTIELRRLLRPLCGLGKNVVVHVSALPLAVAAYITTREVLFVPAEHPFKTYASLAGRVDAAISKVRDAGLCCTRVDSTDNKPCGIRSLEKKLLIVREKIIICDIGSRHAEEELEMDFDALSGFLESRKVRDLVEMADGLLLCLGESFDDCE